MTRNTRARDKRKAVLEMAWHQEQKGRVADLIYEGLHKNRLSMAGLSVQLVMIEGTEEPYILKRGWLENIFGS